MKALSRIIAAAGCVAVAVAAAGCSGGDLGSAASDKTSAPAAATSDEARGDFEQLGVDASTLGISPSVYVDKVHKPGFQLDQPEPGDEVAVIVTDMGEITLRLFPEQAPKTVTNFVNLAREGKYDGTSIDLVLCDSLIQGGVIGSDPSHPNGLSSFGDEFEDEFSTSLLNLRGAVAMSNPLRDCNGSQFFINQTSAQAFAEGGGWAALEKRWGDVKSKLLSYKDSSLLSAYIEENGDRFLNTDCIPGSIRELYTQNGGNPAFDGTYNAADRGCTVFAQVCAGMETVDRIARVSVDEDGAPIAGIEIKTIRIEPFEPAAEETAPAA